MDGPELDSLSLTLPLPYRIAIVIVLGKHILWGFGEMLFDWNVC